MVLFWSKDYVTIYNGSYADVVRNRYPQLLDQELAKGWPEAYEQIHEYLDNCRWGLSIIRSGDTRQLIVLIRMRNVTLTGR